MSSTTPAWSVLQALVIAAAMSFEMPWHSPLQANQCTLLKCFSDGQMKIKPQAGRVALTVPLDTKGPNYNEDAQDALKLKHLTLQSRPAELATTHALGVIRSASTACQLVCYKRSNDSMPAVVLMLGRIHSLLSDIA